MSSRRRARLLASAILLIAVVGVIHGAVASTPGMPAAAARPIAVRMVMAANIDTGVDSGDKPGEYLFWVECDQLDQKLSVPVVHEILGHWDRYAQTLPQSTYR